MNTTETKTATRYQHVKVTADDGAVHLLAIDVEGRVGTTGGKRGAWLCTIGTVRRSLVSGWRVKTYAEAGETPDYTGDAPTMRAGMGTLLEMNPGALGLEHPLQPAPDAPVPDEIVAAVHLAAPGITTAVKRVRTGGGSVQGFVADVIDAEARERCGFDRIIASRAAGGDVVVGMYDTFGPSLRVVRMETLEDLRDARVEAEPDTAEVRAMKLDQRADAFERGGALDSARTLRRTAAAIRREG